MENNDMKLNYSIVSRGTEKHTNKGYMGVIMNDNNSMIIDCDHNTNDFDRHFHILKFGNKYDIYNIVLSRFELISAIMYEENKKLIKNNIVIIGAGNLGFSCLIHLLDKGIKDITLVKNRDTFFLKNAELCN